MLLEAHELKKHYTTRNGVVKAVDGVSFALEPGKTFALVGESGCGKSTLAKLMLLLERPTSGSVRYRGQEVSGLRGRALRQFRREVQAVFQDPYASLNPRLRVGKIVAEPMLAQGDLSRAEIAKRVEEALEVVGLHAAAAKLYPHEFSGGQRQRIAIARALILEPKLIVLDEPISALDVSIRAQVLNILADLRDAYGTGYIFIAHDLAAVATISDRIAVMYLGLVVEVGPAALVARSPAHPYTQMLFSAANPKSGTLPPKGEPPSPIAPPSGCRFHTRCPYARPDCSTRVPQLRDVQGRQVACHYAETLQPQEERV